MKTQAELTGALEEACKAQKDGVTTFIEVLLNQELGEPFRRDAMKEAGRGRRYRSEGHAAAASRVTSQDQ